MRIPVKVLAQNFLRLFCLVVMAFFAGTNYLPAQVNDVASSGVNLLPFPKQVQLKGEKFIVPKSLTIGLDPNASAQDRFAAGELVQALKDKFGINAIISGNAKDRMIILTRKILNKQLGNEGYTISVSAKQVIVRANGEAGLFYGTGTLVQLLQQDPTGIFIAGMEITDWPDTKVRAAHYDTKHHQDTKEFVESFIRDLARYKMNMLVWEWEDKFEYPSHPEIGAPGAFTMKEMQSLTKYAQKYHVQIVPLVQGLGHVSFILKWPQFAHLREIPASNFEFCPLKQQTYSLLADLWKDAIAATPGSEYIHIGSDETYELGKCPDCKKKEAEIGKSGLYHLFLGKSAAIMEGSARKVMAWEAPMGWAKGRLHVYHNDMKAEKPVTPYKGLILTESYDYETADLKYAKEAKSQGYPVFAYDPNPGIEQLFLPYYFGKNDAGNAVKGCLRNSIDFLQSALGKSVYEGVIRTSWDDSGLPMQAWMLSFATTAAYSWNTSGASMEDFLQAFYASRYGNSATAVDSLYRLLNEGAYFYMESFEREVWAWGEIGKTHIPDLPRGDALEYDPFWRTQYAERCKAADTMIARMNTALDICKQNLGQPIENKYDIEVFQSIANLVKHNAQTYLDLAALENSIKAAHESRFTDLSVAYSHLQHAEEIVKAQLSRRNSVFSQLVECWEKTRLPKGMSTSGKTYFFEQDRTRHFANRVPDMKYLIVDEEQLDLEGYLASLQDYMVFFHKRFLSNTPQ